VVMGGLKRLGGGGPRGRRKSFPGTGEKGISS